MPRRPIAKAANAAPSPGTETIARTQQAEPQLKLATSSGSGSRGGSQTPAVDHATHGPRRLKPIFNRAASRPPTLEERIAALETKLSQPSITYEPTPWGNIKGSYDPARDREVRHVMKALKEALAVQRRAAKQRVMKAGMTGNAKGAFNRAARGRGR